MNGIGSVVGVQEGFEAGLVTGGLAAGETKTGQAIAAGLAATAIGVALGHTAGENALTFIDQYVGDGGIGFIPSVAIGSSVMWHNLRSHTPQQSAKNIVKGVTLIGGAGFAAFEGTESGILTSSTQTNLLAAEVVTLTAAGAVALALGNMDRLMHKFSPGKALRWARGVALAPAIYLGAKASPELMAEPKRAGLVIAGIGTTAVTGAIASFFKPKPMRPASSENLPTRSRP